MFAACEILFIRGRIKRDEGISFNLAAASTTRKYRVFTEKLAHDASASLFRRIVESYTRRVCCVCRRKLIIPFIGPIDRFRGLVYGLFSRSARYSRQLGCLHNVRLQIELW